MPHDHVHFNEEAGDRRILLAIAVNVALSLVQIAGGILSGSLALIADAVHNFSDALSIIIAYGARKIARRPATKRMTFGHGRIEDVAALVNYVTLIIMGLWLAGQGIERLANPSEITGGMVIVLAALALVVDAVTAALMFSMSKGSHNIRAAFLHNVADALASIGVIVAGVIIVIWDWRLIDPLVTLAIAGYILWIAFGEIGGVIRALMLGTPKGIDPDDVIRALHGLPGVADAHNIRIWAPSAGEIALDGHLALEVDDWSTAITVRDAARHMLQDGFGITRMTLELEPAGSCEAAPQFGYPPRDGSQDHHHH